MSAALSVDRHIPVTSGDDQTRMDITKTFDHPLYDLVQIGNKPKNPVSLMSLALGAGGLLSTGFFIKALFDNVTEAEKRGQDNLWPSWLFAVSQVLENGK